ncbi:drug resistance transporter, EmrB/QacA subfamily [Klenkia soli]|uniref:Drug resistance transporter, EmrB/QacA subfamily n=1 Tax=Klenkia soli TaxID=1052260 RepID=A0A1H0BFP1_9ACTN|nr:MFS transporter [Klenkia soli]SDN44203.1 drug resistance transporter, EmrB/QacA subfamily [Klenkia soli]
MTDPASATTDHHPYPQRWLALAVIAVTVLMIVLDATIVNIALPAVSVDLDISEANQQWIVTAYTLTFGGFLLLGGRIADFWGRKRTYLVGAVGFALASALGGLATNEALLFAARALQGTFGALLGPASLALITVLFTDAAERAKAFAVYGAIAGGGSAVGLLLGGVLTEYADWRWCFWVNVPIAVLAVVAAWRIVPESRAPGETTYDVPGAVLVTVGLASLVYGFTKVAEAAQSGDGGSPWANGPALTFILVGAALVVAFVVVEFRVRNPLLPMRLVLDRNRGGAYLTATLVGAGLIGSFFFLSLYFQQVLGYTPVSAGFASLPVTAGVLVAAGTASQLVPRLGPKPLMVAGGVFAAGGLFTLSFLGLDTAFWQVALPGQVLLGLGLGFTFVPLSNLALVGVGEHDAGAASAVLQAVQQVGASIGTALLATFSVTAITNSLAERPPTQEDPTAALVAQVDGYTTAFTWGAGFLLVAALVSAVLVRASKDDLPTGAAVHAG